MPIDAQRDAGIALLTLNRPGALNALTDAMVAELGQWPEALAVDSPTRVLLITGAGLALALGAEIRCAATSARFNAAFVKVGMTGCEMGASWLLPRAPAAAREIDANDAPR